MERVSVDDVENSVRPAAVVRGLTDPLGATDLALNWYELTPGDSFGFAYHCHENQEEVFVVIEGTATFETEDGDVEVGPREAIRFAPGEFQRGWNRGDERVVALALGAPQQAGASTTLVDCPDCGERTDNRIERADDGDFRTVCQVCGTETGRWTRGDDGENEWVE